MGYRLDLDIPVEQAVQAVARDLLSDLRGKVGAARTDELDRDEAIHEIRSQMKKLRALLRLVRPALGPLYKDENRFFRDLARRFGRSRDARVLLDTAIDLQARFEDEQSLPGLASVRAALEERWRRILEEEDIPARLLEADQLLDQGLERVGSWSLGCQGYDAIAGGLRQTYARGRRAMKEAARHPGGRKAAHRFHEWRKQAKYHRYHVSLLEGAWPGVMEAREKELHHLSDFLGLEHDLTVLLQVIEQERPGRPEEREVVQAIARERQQELRLSALQLGRKLYAEKPGRLVERVAVFWETASTA